MCVSTVSAASLFPATEHLNWRHATCESDEDSNEGEDLSAYFLEDCKWGPLYNTQALQGYILLCCQVYFSNDIHMR